MKKLFFYIVLFVAVLTMVSCEKDKTIAGYLPVTISQYQGGDNSKVFIDNQNYACWVAGDPVCLNGEESDVVVASGKYRIPIPGTLNVNASTVYYAIYPYSAVSNYSNYSVTLPAIQHYVEVSENVQKIDALMAATGTTLLSFKNLCALLRVDVSCIPANTATVTYHLTKIEVTVTGDDPIAGTGHIDFSNSSNPSLIMDNGVKTLKLQFDGNTKSNGSYYITVPPVMGKFEVKVHYAKQVSGQNDQTLYTLTYAQADNATLLKNQIGPVAAVPRNNVTPEEHLPGAFSINGDVVYFSRGVLKCENGSNGVTWSFENNQYSATGYVGHSHSFTHSAFMPYSTTYNNSGFPILSDANHGSFWEWGQHISSDNHWQTLSRADWTMLLTQRSASTLNGVADARFAYAKVNDQYGLMLFPDLFAWPEGDNAPTLIAAANINASSVASAAAPEYNLVQWKELEDAGVVFLPALGHYQYQTADGRYVPADEGWYWTCDVDNGTSESSGTAYYMHFPSVVTYSSCSMGYGLLVRLVYKY